MVTFLPYETTIELFRQALSLARDKDLAAMTIDANVEISRKTRGELKTRGQSTFSVVVSSDD